MSFKGLPSQPCVLSRCCLKKLTFLGHKGHCFSFSCLGFFPLFNAKLVFGPGDFSEFSFGGSHNSGVLFSGLFEGLLSGFGERFSKS